MTEERTREKNSNEKLPEANTTEMAAGGALGATGGAVTGWGVGATQGAQAGMTAGGAMGAASGGVAGWGIGITQGALLGIVVGIFMGMAVGRR